MKQCFTRKKYILHKSCCCVKIVETITTALLQPFVDSQLATSQIIDGVVIFLFLFPESKVLLEELNDGLGISEVVLLELVDLIESVLEGLVGKLAGGGVVLHDFVVEDREV